jgi:hypothetical protein
MISQFEMISRFEPLNVSPYCYQYILHVYFLYFILNASYYFLYFQLNDLPHFLFVAIHTRTCAPFALLILLFDGVHSSFGHYVALVEGPGLKVLAKKYYEKLLSTVVSWDLRIP